MAINFCFDRMSSPGVLGYPNLADPDLPGDEFDHRWPRTTPLRLLVYFKMAGIKSRSFTVTDAPQNSWYPVALAWHDFDCDYFSLMSTVVCERLRRKEIRALFYYHEGDDPTKIKQRFDYLCAKNQLPLDCYLFVSGNTQADTLENFVFFPDYEYFFRYLNRRQPMPAVDDRPRSYEFTVLNRTHKWWRAACMADLYHHGLLDRSLWSYNTSCNIDEDEADNPLELDSIYGWRQHTKKFVSEGPYFCDDQDEKSHNDHRWVPLELYTQSYCHIVIESQFDADGSNGTFMSEKTTKAIKFGQPFVIVGTHHSLDLLRSQGYRVFDHAIDNSYDRIENNTQRWFAVSQAIQKIRSANMHEWFLQCLADIEHNQKVFNEMKNPALDMIAQRLLCNLW